jgi:hypothetical protein
MSIIKDISEEDKIETIKQFPQFIQIDYKPFIAISCYGKPVVVLEGKISSSGT